MSSCAVLGVLLFGLLTALAAHLPVFGFASVLRAMSGLPCIRDPKDVGVPPWIVGVFERMMAYLLIYFFSAGDAVALLAVWIGLKLASNWQRRPLIGKAITLEQEREIRVQSLVALMTGTISVAIGAGAGAIAL